MGATDYLGEDAALRQFRIHNSRIYVEIVWIYL